MVKEISLTEDKVAFVDDEDYPLVSQYKWYVSGSHSNWYAIRNNRLKSLIMHRLILNIPKDFECDHINGNGLDNRRCNLRIVTKAQNQMNRRKSQSCSSNFKGVTWYKSRNKWIVTITINQKQIYLGRYVNEIDAAKAYDEAAKRLFGEYARLNFKE